MTRTKVWRLSLTAILGFGWLFLTPAYSNDPLSLAAQEIQELKSKVPTLNYKVEFESLISLAEDKYDNAVHARDTMDSASDAYDLAVSEESSALQEKINAQSAVDGQTATVSIALSNKNNAQDELNAAAINLQAANINLQEAQSQVNSAGGEGLQYTVYNLLRDGSTAVPGSVICTGVWNSNSMQLPVCGRYENLIVKFTGIITVPSYWTSTYFAGYTDDGFRMYINGELAVNNWVEQGVRWSPYSPVYDVSEDKTLDVEIWWYNGGGPGSYHLGWAIPGGWTGAGCDYTGGWGIGFSCNLNTFSSGSQPTQQQLDNFAAAQQAQATAQQTYNDKLEVRNDKVSIYNIENNQLNTYSQDLVIKTSEYDTAVNNTDNCLSNKNNATAAYDQSVIDLNLAIDNAWEYYNEQLKREIAIAIAQALANQPQPTPETSSEPSIESTPEASPQPSPEQTKPSDPSPTPNPETTNEPKPEPSVDPKPTTEPSLQPSPLPSNISPEPTYEPEPTPAAPSPKPSTDNITDDLGAIANLTSKDNKLVKLTPEQAAAVANVLVELSSEAKTELAKDLGIRSSEIAVIAEAMKNNPILASAVVEFSSRAEENANAAMPYTLADATTELQTEAFLSDPLGAFVDIDFEKIFSPAEWGKDMTDDQREKAQEVIVPVIIAGNIVAAAMTRRI